MPLPQIAKKRTWKSCNAIHTNSSNHHQVTIVRKNLPHCKKVKVKNGNSNGEVLRKIRATDSRNLEHLQQSASNNNLTHLRWKKLQRHVVNSNGGIISPSNHSAPHLLVNTRSNHQTVIKSWTVSWTLIKPYYFDVVLIHYYKVAVELRNRTCNCMIFILNYVTIIMAVYIVIYWECNSVLKKKRDEMMIE